MLTQNKTVIFILMVCAVALGNAGTTLYLPALVNIANSLHTTGSMMKLSLSCYLISFGLSQIFYGPLSDAYGRRINLIVGLIIFAIGGVVSASATAVWVLLVGRIIEGVGIGTANAVGYAAVRDIYEGDVLVRKLSLISVFVGLVPIIAPLFGGYLTQYIDWRACFVVLVLSGLGLAVIKHYKVPETNLHLDANACKPSVAYANYKFLFKSSVFRSYALSNAFGFGTMMVILDMLPLLMIDTLHMSPATYGWLSILIGGGYMAGAYIAGRIAKRFGILNVMTFGICLLAVMSLIGYIIGLFYLNVVAVSIPIILCLFAGGFIVPIGASGAMRPFPKMAGSSAALMGTSLCVGAAILTAISSHLHELTQQPMMIYVLITSLLALIILRTGRHSEATSL